MRKRYSFLDRDLLEFLFNMPRDQLVRPNQRRSLFRRAMRGIVPDLVLDRPRKAFRRHRSPQGHRRGLLTDEEVCELLKKADESWASPNSDRGTHAAASQAPEPR